MKIISVKLYRSEIPLKAPFKISLGTLHFAENVFVVMDTDEGITGYGECSPFMTINGESADTAFITGKKIAEQLVGKDPCNTEGLHQVMDQLIYGNTSIKSAFDIALYDIASQHAGQPLYTYLGGQNNDKIRTDYTVSIDKPDKMASDAENIKKRGFPVIKVKLGGSMNEDLTRIRVIRERISNELPIRIDANQGWNADTAIEILKKLEPFNIEHCEEPIPRWDFMNLAKVKEQSPIPVMADESCCDHHDAQRLVDLKACDSFNLKLGKSSGIFKALKIIDIAESAGLSMQVGGFLESRLATTAAVHLALCSKNIRFYDFDVPLMHDEDPVTGGIEYGNNGQVIVPEKDGLGAGLSEEFMESNDEIVVEYNK